MCRPYALYVLPGGKCVGKALQSLIFVPASCSHCAHYYIRQHLCTPCLQAFSLIPRCTLAEQQAAHSSKALLNTSSWMYSVSGRSPPAHRPRTPGVSLPIHRILSHRGIQTLGLETQTLALDQLGPRHPTSPVPTCTPLPAPQACTCSITGCSTSRTSTGARCGSWSRRYLECAKCLFYNFELHGCCRLQAKNSRLSVEWLFGAVLPRHVKCPFPHP